MPEVVLGEGKTAEQIVGISQALLEHADRLLVTRIHPDAAAALLAAVPDAKHHELARCVTVERAPVPKQDGVAVVCAGTADLPVAEEAAITAEMCGNAVAPDVRRRRGGHPPAAGPGAGAARGAGAGRRGRDGGRAAERRRRAS